MNHDSFRSAFDAALQSSGLPVFGVRGEELLDLHYLDRLHRIAVEPIGQDAEPFWVTASLSWRWSALQTARTNTTEEDVVTDLLGRDEPEGVRTERPWIRIDIVLKATLPYGKPLAMPAPAAMRKWFHETMTRLEQVEPLTPDEHLRDEGRLAIVAWQEAEPRVHALCQPSGDLMLEAVVLATWQAIDVPRIVDDPDHEPDRGRLETGRQVPSRHQYSDPRTLSSASHGAGRAVSRFSLTRAGAKVDEETLGLRVEAGLVRVVARMKPLMTFKA